MKMINGKNLLDIFRRANTSQQVTEENAKKQKKSGGYNGKRVRYGRSGDTSGNGRGSR